MDPRQSSHERRRGPSPLPGGSVRSASAWLGRIRVCASRPELTKRPSGTHKLRQGLSENLSTRVSAQSANPTGISVEAGPQLSNPIRHRFGVHGKRVISDTLINTAATCGQRAID